MKVITLVSSVLLYLFWPVASADEQRNMAPPDEVVTQIHELMSQAQIPGLAIAKIENGAVSWHGAFGMRGEGEELEADTIFNAASLTKPVFATMAMQLVAEDALELDESLAKYWIDPDVADDTRHKNLTARLILSHQSGLPNWRGERELAFMFKPGERHEYSGEGYQYLRRAIENKLKTDLSALTQKYVFKPAGMKNSSMGWNNALGNNVATGFDEEENPIYTAIEKREPNAAANLMTTVQDYARFLGWVSEGADLPSELFTEMRTPQALHENPAERFGLGWKLIPMGKADALFHDGRESGVRTYAVIHPDMNEGLVILTNSTNGDLSFRPLAEATLSFGEQLTQSTDRLVWTYLNSLPGQALMPMSRGISKSPAYLNTLLHAVNTTLVQTSTLSPQDKSAATKAISKAVLALLNKKSTPQKIVALISQLFMGEGQDTRLVQTFDSGQAKDWVNSLQNVY